MKLVVIVPTRGRPENAKRLINSFTHTVAGGFDTELIFGVDNDDPMLSEYKQLASENIWVKSGPRLRMAGTLNDIARKVAPSFDIIGFMGDDHLPQTYGWDDRIREAMIPGGIVYGNDLIQGAALPTEVFLDAEIVRRIGFVPEGFKHLFLDNTWKTWGEQTDKLIYLDDVVIEHLHPLVGKAESDEGYTEVNSAETWSADEQRYNEYVANGELERDLELLRSIGE